METYRRQLRGRSWIASKPVSSAWWIVALWLISAAALRGQSPLDGFDPNANARIRVVVVQPDGKILIGGNFTSIAPNGGPTVTRNHIARLNPDGTLDTAFDPNANGNVYAIALQADGKILVGGSFNGANSIGGQARNRIARLDSTTGLADSFDPNADFAVNALVVQPNGKILAAGCFDTIGGQLRNYIARLDPMTGLADSFDPSGDNCVNTVALQSDGKILVGGSFVHIGGQSRARIARLNLDGTADPNFDPHAIGSPFGLVLSIAIQPDGKILAGGQFNFIGGQTRNNIARLDATAGAADSFNPNANNNVESIALEADGKILVGGDFVGANSIGGQTRNYVARLDPISGLADSFNPNADNIVFAVATQADGKVLVGGDFINVVPNGGATVARNRVARLEIDGRADQTLNLSMPSGSFIFATAVQPDGKILIGGLFPSVSGVTRNNIARLNTDGTLDTAFNPSANSSVYCIVVQPDGRILVGGAFNGANSIGGQTRNRIARLDGTTGLADSFDPNATNYLTSIAVQADGKIVVAGAFAGVNSIGGQARARIARLDPTTGLADSWNPMANAIVNSIAVQLDGKILAAGNFGTIGGQMRNQIARLDATMGLADSFDPNSDNTVGPITLQTDGKVLAGGVFANIGGQMRNRMARLDPGTGLADSFDPNASDLISSIAVLADGKILVTGDFNGANSIGGQLRNRIARLDSVAGLADSFDPNANNRVLSGAVQTDGKILAGGTFTSIGGQTRNSFARLSNDIAALQNLAITQTSITWTRSGSSPQFTRVTFESSNDNMTYTPVGDGTPFGSDWILTGLNLPSGQNIYIRARGYYRSGYLNGSESIQQSVRNVFLSGTPTVTSAVSRKTHGGAGTFDINLPLTGTPAVECRTGGASNDYTIVVTFSGNVSVTGTPQAEITLGTGCVGSGGVCNSGTVTVSGAVVTIPLTNIANAQTINVRLNGVNPASDSAMADVTIPMTRRLGDTNGNGSVSSSDIAQTKSRIGQPLDNTNFRSDVNLSGGVNSSDVSIIKSNLP